MANDVAPKVLNIDAAVDQLLKSPKFTAAVLAQNLAGAANAAAVLLFQQTDAQASRLRNAVSAASSTCLANLDSFRAGDRVLVQLSSGQGRTQEAVVSSTTDSQGAVNIQLQVLGPVPNGAAGPAGPLAGALKAAKSLTGRIATGAVPSELLTPKLPGLYSASGTYGYTPNLGASLRATPASTPATLPEVLDVIREQLYDMEEKVPWTAVRRSWRVQRSSWRRSVRGTALLTEMAVRIRELLLALATDDAPFPGCGTAWRNTLDGVCIGQHQQPPLLLTLWEEFRTSLVHWLEARDPPPGGEDAEHLSKNAQRAVKALQKAALVGPEALQQVPLEAIVGHDRNGLMLVRQTLEAQRQAALAQMDTAASGSHTNLLTSVFFDQEAGSAELPEDMKLWGQSMDELADADMDSDVPTEEEEVNSEVTNMADSD